MLYEAGNDAIGQMAVGQVVLNRVRHPAFPHSVCGVITQGSERATGCQFTFTCDGALSRVYADAVVQAALRRADMMLNGLVYRGVGLATHYHTDQVYPWWSPKLEKIARVGSHLFFRWPGYWGSAAALVARHAGAEPATNLFARFGSLGVQAPSAAAATKAPLIEAQLGFDDQDNASGALQPLGGREARARASVGSADVIPASRRLVLPWQRPAPVAASLTAAPAVNGMKLLRMFPDTGAIFVELAAGANEATLRRSAQALCGGRAKCDVYGWHSASEAPPTLPPERRFKTAPAFRFAWEPGRGGRMVPPSANAL
ncbi:cell wall hydrolase [Novosphingobium sp. 9U]|uniref:cell wall hydrolase n=1 Tax=Novosphingobium sp. 9U TaxID=2653158 RepID=UPI0012F1BAFE|nr:hypothetical protein NOVOSPHI9U_20032 [Novosphingobium sp. 9U]